MAKKSKKSRNPSGYAPGQEVYLTNEVAGYVKGDHFIVDDPEKKPAKIGGKRYKYTVGVFHMLTHALLRLPTKYIDEV